MSDLNIGCSSLVFRHILLEDSLTRIAELGFKEVEIALIPDFCPHIDPINIKDREINSIIDTLRNRNLRLNGLTVYPGFINSSSKDFCINFIRKSVVLASKIGAKYVTINAGQKVNRDRWFIHVSYVTRIIRELADYCELHKIFLSVETPHKGTLIENLNQTLLFHKILDDDRVNCTFDTSHILRGEKYGIDQSYNLLIKQGIRINNLHLRDCVSHNIKKSLGNGNGNFHKFFRTLNQNNYKETITLEHESESSNSDKIYDEIVTSQIFLRELKGSISLKERIRLNGVTRRLRTTKENIRDIRSTVKRHPLLFIFSLSVFTLFNKLKPRNYYVSGWESRSPLVNIIKDSFSPKRFFSGLTVNNKGRIKVAILGCGWAGKVAHGLAYKKIRDVEIVAVCDTDHQRSESASKSLACRSYTNLDDMLKSEDIDIVSNCTPELQHYDTTMKILDCGVDVFCEKIMAESVNQASSMFEKASNNNRILAVNYNYRQIPSIKELKRIIESKQLGDLQVLNFMVHSFSYHHIIDMATFLGGRVVSVYGKYKNSDNLRPFHGTDWSKFEDEILYIPTYYSTAVLEFENGGIANITSSIFFDINTFLFSIDSIFEKGVVTVSGFNIDNMVGHLSSSVDLKRHLHYYKNLKSNDISLTFDSSLSSFIESYIKGEKYETGGKHGLGIAMIEKAIGESNKSGKCISLEGKI